MRIEYSGWTSSGVMFRSTHGHGPTTLRAIELIPGWAEGLRRMVEGEKTRLWIPEALAYQGQPGQPAGMLTLDVHLVEILPARSEPQ